MNQECNTSLNGGNNYLENQKEKTKREFTLQVLTSQLICIHWVNISKKAAATSLKLLLKLKNHVNQSQFLRKKLTLMDLATYKEKKLIL